MFFMLDVLSRLPTIYIYMVHSKAVVFLKRFACQGNGYLYSLHKHLAISYNIGWFVCTYFMIISFDTLRDISERMFLFGYSYSDGDVWCFLVDAKYIATCLRNEATHNQRF